MNTKFGACRDGSLVSPDKETPRSLRDETEVFTAPVVAEGSASECTSEKARGADLRSAWNFIGEKYFILSRRGSGVHEGFERCLVFYTTQARRIRAPRRAMLACSGVARPAPPLGSAVDAGPRFQIRIVVEVVFPPDSAVAFNEARKN